MSALRLVQSKADISLSPLNCLSAQGRWSGQAADAPISDIQPLTLFAPKRTVRNHHELMQFPPARAHSPLGCMQAVSLENVSWNKAYTSRHPH